MKGRGAVDAPAGLVVPGAVGGFGRGDGVAGAPSFGQGLVVEQQRRPGPPMMPLQVAGQQAKEQVRPAPHPSGRRSPYDVEGVRRRAGHHRAREFVSFV